MSHRMLVVEDDPEWQSIFSGLIQHSALFELGYMASTLAEAKDVIEAERFDAALIDVGLPDGAGIDLLPLLSRRQPWVDVAICTVFEDERTVLNAITAGARGYILKHEAVDGLISLLGHMKEGGAPLSPAVARHILNQFSQRQPVGNDAPHTAFTHRELEVLRKVAGGLTLKQAAKHLEVAESTIRTHVKSLYAKLGVNNRGAAVLEATRRRLV